MQALPTTYNLLYNLPFVKRIMNEPAAIVFLTSKNMTLPNLPQLSTTSSNGI